MNKAMLSFITAALCLTILAGSSGKYGNLWAFAGYIDSADAVQHAQPVTGESQIHHGNQSQMYSFGDTADRHSILLHLTQSPDQDLKLTAMPSDFFSGQQGVVVCTHTGQPVISQPENVASQNWRSVQNDANLWQRASSWFTSKAEDSYFITIRPPFESDVEYVLVSGDGPTAPVVCSGTADKDV